MSLAQRTAEAFSNLQEVEAVALGGSQAGGTVDEYSDIDIYIYTTSPIPGGDREALLAKLGGTSIEINYSFWDVADLWHDAATNIEVEAIYWQTSWIERILDRVLVQHQASNAYSTSHWYKIRNSVPLYDRQGWFKALQQRSRQSYPETLRMAIIARNHALLRKSPTSYLHQIEKADRRGDIVSVQHRLTGLLASYFDVIFALNRVLHPGEKRLLELAAERCAKVPANMQTEIPKVLHPRSNSDPCW